jgi:hypothetical protein
LSGKTTISANLLAQSIGSQVTTSTDISNGNSLTYYSNATTPHPPSACSGSTAITQRLQWLVSADDCHRFPIAGW